MSNKHLGFHDVDIDYGFTYLTSSDDPSIDITTKLSQNHVLKCPIIYLNQSRYDRIEYFAASKFGCLCIVESKLFESAKHLNDEIAILHNAGVNIGFTIGINPDDVNIIDTVLTSNPTLKNPVVFINSEYGDSQSTIEQIRKVALKFGKSITIMAGSINTPIGIQKAIMAGATIITTNCDYAVTTTLNLHRTIFGMTSNIKLISYQSNASILQNPAKALIAGADALITRDSTNIDNIIKTIRGVMYHTNCRTIHDLFNTGMFIERI